MFFLSVGVEGGFDITEEKFEYDEDVKIVIFPEHLDIPRDGLEGLPDMVRDRVCLDGGRCLLLAGRQWSIAVRELLPYENDSAKLLWRLSLKQAGLFYGHINYLNSAFIVQSLVYDWGSQMPCVCEWLAVLNLNVERCGTASFSSCTPHCFSCSSN